MGAAALPVIALAVTAIGTGVATYSAVQQSNAASEQASYQEAIAKQNASILDQQAKDAILRGEQAKDANDRKVAAIRARARAAAAGTGVDVNAGSALDNQTDITTLGALDSSVIRQNAQREAYGLRTQQTGQLASANMSAAAAGSYNPMTAGAGNLLQGAGQFADQWYKYDSAGAFKGLGG